MAAASNRRASCRALVLLAASLALAGCQTTPDAPEPTGDYGALVGKAFGDGGEQLLLLLHGDVSGGGPARYHYSWAQQFSLAYPDATVVALVRPGYENAAGERSGGNNYNRRDQYTEANNALVADAIRAARQRHPAAKVVVAGHSGGAAQLGTVIGTHPGLVDTAVLLACPCNIDKWRARVGARPWRRSQSPHRAIEGIGADTRVIAVVGSEDANTFPALSEEYVAAASAAGIDAQYMLAPGGDHHGNGALMGTFRAAVDRAFRD